MNMRIFALKAQALLLWCPARDWAVMFVALRMEFTRLYSRGVCSAKKASVLSSKTGKIPKWCPLEKYEAAK